MVIPGVSSGTMIIDCCRWGSASGSVMPMKIETVQLARPALDVHHLRPLMTYSSPSRSMRDWMLRASEDATAGSVMEKQDRISPSRRGTNHCSCCARVPYLASTSMFPVSGALQLKTSGAKETWPMSSARGAYSRLVRPAPHSSSGRNRFHNPAAFALAFRSSTICGWWCGSPLSRICSS